MAGKRYPKMAVGDAFETQPVDVMDLPVPDSLLPTSSPEILPPESRAKYQRRVPVAKPESPAQEASPVSYLQIARARTSYHFEYGHCMGCVMRKRITSNIFKHSE